MLQHAGLTGSGGAPGLSGAALGSGGAGAEKQYARYTKVALPSPKPLAPKESLVAERLFIVIAPDIVPDYILEDCFCRFGNMISAYFMPGNSTSSFYKILWGAKLCFTLFSCTKCRKTACNSNIMDF